MTVGPHLLGRVPSPPDERDYPLRVFLDGGDALDAALAALAASRAAASTKAWARVATARIHALERPGPLPPPSPAPPPVAGGRYWLDPRQLDQGDSGHCVGFGWAQWGNTDPVEDHLLDADGHAIYYECKVIDGQPGQENGSDVRSGAKAMVARGRLAAYAFAASTDEVTAWLRDHGPVVAGTDWTQDMFSPDARGIVTATGAVAGGHCYVLCGVDEGGGIYELQNSWGASWGVDGRARISVADFARLLAQGGEACAAAELP